MLASKTQLDEVVIIEPKILSDERGFFVETFKRGWFCENIANVEFVQDNQSLSKDIGTIRGLHYQSSPFEQGKLIRVISGSIYDVAVDIRPNSPNFGKWVAIELSADNFRQLWIPCGFAHGFCTLAPDTIVCYKVTNPYSAEHDKGLAFDDSDIGIEWPVVPKDAILSVKDRQQPKLKSLLV